MKLTRKKLQRLIESMLDQTGSNPTEMKIQQYLDQYHPGSEVMYIDPDGIGEFIYEINLPHEFRSSLPAAQQLRDELIDQGHTPSYYDPQDPMTGIRTQQGMISLMKRRSYQSIDAAPQYKLHFDN